MKWTPSGHRGEFDCEHSIGHGPHIHGCDGCCSRDDYPYKDFPRYLRELARPRKKVLIGDLKWALVLAATRISMLQAQVEDLKQCNALGDTN